MSLKKSALFHLIWNNEPLRRATPAGIPLTGPALVFISVRRGEIFGRAAWESSHSLGSCALSSGCSPFVRQVDSTRMLRDLASSELHRRQCILRRRNKTGELNAKTVILWMTALSCEWPVTASHKLVPLKPASPARPPHLGSSIIAVVKPEHYGYSNRRAKPHLSMVSAACDETGEHFSSEMQMIFHIKSVKS